MSQLTWQATPNLGIADRRVTFYHANVYATCLLVLAWPYPVPIGYMEENNTRCFMRFFACDSNMAIINSANYPENFLKFRSYVFTLTALKMQAEIAIEL